MTAGPVETGGSETGGTKPWYRNVWVLATLSSMVTITLLRPCMRHVPEPPPKAGTLTPWVLATADGRPFGATDLAGQIYVLGFYGEGGGEASDAVLRALGRLQARYAQDGSPIRLVAVRIGNGPLQDLSRAASAMKADPARWTFVGGAGSAELAKALDALHGEAHPTPWSHGLALIDASGVSRGFYGTAEPGTDEAFHRSLHVLDELAKKKREAR